MTETAMTLSCRRFHLNQMKNGWTSGANTGFFTYSLAHQFPEANFLAIEANPDHACFLDEIWQAFRIKNVRISSDSIGLNDLDRLRPADVMLHLNVLHHAGADFDEHHVSDRTSFLHYAVRYLTKLKMATRILILQVGLNLWGNKGLPIFPIADSLGALKSLISLIRTSGWEVRSLAYPAIQPSGKFRIAVFQRPLSANWQETSGIATGLHRSYNLGIRSCRARWRVLPSTFASARTSYLMPILRRVLRSNSLGSRRAIDGRKS